MNNTSFGVFNRVANVSVNGTDRNIKPMQAFWIYANSEAELSLNNSMRKIQFTEGVQPNVNGIRLTVSGNSYKDEAVVAFSNQATDAYDEFDSYKMLATDKSFPQLYSQTELGNSLAINTMSEVDWTEGTTIDLIFTSGNEGNYTINLSDVGSFNSDVSISITDEAGLTSLIYFETPFTFEYLSSNTNKLFTLNLKKEVTSYNEISLENIQIYSHRKDVFIQIPNTINKVELLVYDVTGRFISNKSLNSGENNIKLNAEGIFFIQLNGPTEKITSKIITW